MTSLVDAIVTTLPTLVVPLIVVLFYVDGMVIGKLTPPGALFVAYVAIVRPTSGVLAAVAAASVVASTLGQWTLYRGFDRDSPEFFGIRRRVPYADRLPDVVEARVSGRRLRFVSRTFDRFGGAGLCVTNAIPDIRSLMAIPAGLASYHVPRFLLFSTLGNVGYLLLLVALAEGLIVLF